MQKTRNKARQTVLQSLLRQPSFGAILRPDDQDREAHGRPRRFIVTGIACGRVPCFAYTEAVAAQGTNCLLPTTDEINNVDFIGEVAGLRSMWGASGGGGATGP